MKIRLFSVVTMLLTTLAIAACNSSADGSNINDDQSDKTVSIANFEKTTDGFLGKIDNNVQTFSFINRVSVPKNATWSIYYDVSGTVEIPTKTIECNIGDNLVYLLVNNEKESIGFYKVNVYRFDLFTVSFNTNGGSYIEPQKVQEESLATKPQDPTKTGYAFSQWDFDFSTPILSDKTINASWNANQYTITFDVNGGNPLDSTSLVVTYGQNVTFPVPTWTGHTFLGWYNNNQKFSSGFWRTDRNVDLIAKWENSQYTITYYVNGGTLSNSSNVQTVVYGQPYTLYTASRTGYEFDGWFNGSTKFESGTWNLESNIELLAQWTANQYTITYYLNGGSQSESTTQIVTYDQPFTLPVPNRTGYEFQGWFDISTKVESGIWNYPFNKELTAHWTACSYNVTLFSYDSSSIVSVSYDSNYDFGTVAKTGYTFYGWYTGQNGSGTKLTDQAGKSLSPWTYTNVNSAYAYLAKNKYTITYVPNGGTLNGSTTQEVTYDESFTLRTVTREGYSFQGWLNGSEQISSGVWTCDGNLTLTAQWKANSYQVTLSEISNACHYYLVLNKNNGTPNTKIEVSRDTPISYPTPPTKSKNLFMGWYSDSACTKVFDFSQNINEDTNIYAKWRDFSKYSNPIFDDLSGKTYQMSSTYDDNIWFYVAAYQDTTYRLNYTFYSTGARSAYVYFYDIDDGQSNYSPVAHPSASGSYSMSVKAGHVYLVSVSPDSWYSDKKISCTLTGSYPTPSTVVGDSPNLTLNFEYDKSYSLGVPDSREGKTFVGWYTGENGTGTKLTNASGNSLSVWKFVQQITVYPYFE